jgi:two-component system, NarL family, nitrate/nitrite response regulator NarL
MSLIIVSESGIVSHALEKSALKYFESVRCVTKIRDIETLSADTRVILYDHRGTGSDAGELLDFELKFSDALSKVVVLTRENIDLRDIFDLLGRVGAILPHTIDTEDILLLAHCLRSGLFFLPTELLKLVRTASSNHSAMSSPDTLDLTPRQRAVLAMLAEGQSNKLIARSLGINDTTVRVHVRAVLRKLGVHNRTQAALVASRYLNT